MSTSEKPETATIKPEDVKQVNAADLLPPSDRPAFIPVPPQPIGFDTLVQQGGEADIPPGAMVPMGTNVPATSTDDDARTEMSTQFRTWTSQPKMRASDISYPRLRIAQGLTPEVIQGAAKMGDLVMSGAEAVQSAVLIPVMWARARELRKPGDNSTVLCQSVDGVEGKGVPGGHCETAQGEDLCPMSKWGAPSQPGGRNTPPQCNLIYSYVCYSLTHKMLVVFELKRTGMNQAKFINTMIERNGLGRFAVILSSQNKTNPNRQTYAEPVVVPSKVEDAQIQEALSALL